MGLGVVGAGDEEVVVLAGRGGNVQGLDVSEVLKHAAEELEGGLQEKIRVSLPAVLAIQSGINEPRYVSIMGVRKASKVERKFFKAKEYEDGVKRLIEVERWVYPPKKGGAQILSGELETVCKDLLGILKEKGVYQ